jgi:hypothetical protein
VNTKFQRETTWNIKWDNIKMDLKEIGFEDVNWTEIVWDWVSI